MVYRGNQLISNNSNVQAAALSAQMGVPIQAKKDSVNAFLNNPNYAMYYNLASGVNGQNNQCNDISGIPFATNAAQSMMATFAGVGYIFNENANGPEGMFTATRNFQNTHDIPSHTIIGIGESNAPLFSNTEALSNKASVVNLKRNGQIYN